MKLKEHKLGNMTYLGKSDDYFTRFTIVTLLALIWTWIAIGILESIILINLMYQLTGIIK